jgi:hypothetical protein
MHWKNYMQTLYALQYLMPYADPIMLEHDVHKEKEKPLVVVAIVLFFRQKSSVPAAGKVLLKTTISLWVGVF